MAVIAIVEAQSMTLSLAKLEYAHAYESRAAVCAAAAANSSSQRSYVSVKNERVQDLEQATWRRSHTRPCYYRVD